MAATKETLKSSYPLPVYNYKVRIGADTYGFSQVSGLSVQYEIVTYKHGLSWLQGSQEAVGQLQPLTITLQKGVASGGSELLDWFSATGFMGIKKQDVFIDLCDENGVPVVTWAVRDAFPTKLEAPSFSAADNEVAIEVLELKAGNISVNYHESGQSGNF
jgi:phage tail-like protein